MAKRKNKAPRKESAGETRTTRDVGSENNSGVTPVIWATPSQRSPYKYPAAGIGIPVDEADDKPKREKKDGAELPGPITVATQLNPRLVLCHTKPLAPLFHGWKPESETATFDCFENCYMPVITNSGVYSIRAAQLNFPSNGTDDDVQAGLSVTDHNWTANAVSLTPTTPAAEVFATEVWPTWNKLFYRMYQNETKAMPLSAFVAYLGFVNDIQCLIHDVVVALGMPQPDFANIDQRAQTELDVIYASYKPEYSSRLTRIIERASKLPAIKGFVQFTNDCLQPFRPATLPECVIVPITEVAFGVTKANGGAGTGAAYSPFIQANGIKQSLNVVPTALDRLELLLDKVYYEFESEIAEMLLRMPDTLGSSNFISINTPLIDIEMTEALMNSGIDWLYQARPSGNAVCIAGNMGDLDPKSGSGQVVYESSQDDPASGFWYPDAIAEKAVRSGIFWAYTDMGMSMRSLMNVPVYIRDSDALDKEYAHSGLVCRHATFVLSVDPNVRTSAHYGWVRLDGVAFADTKNIQVSAAAAKYKSCRAAWLDSNVREYEFNYLAYRDVIEAMVVAMGISQANVTLEELARGAGNPVASPVVSEQMSR